MYDDTNWCMGCDCQFDGPGVYCSLECSPDTYYKPSVFYNNQEEDDDDDDDDEVIYHHVNDAPMARWIGNGSAGILAWAADVEPTSPSSPSSPCVPRSRSAFTLAVKHHSPRSKTPRPKPASASPVASTFRVPKLMQLNRRTALPALSVTLPPHIVPAAARPSPSPIFTLQQQYPASSTGSLSQASEPTDSSLATPPLGASLLGALRSWVAPASEPMVVDSVHHHDGLTPSAAKRFELDCEKPTSAIRTPHSHTPIEAPHPNAPPFKKAPL
ncbi:hypothetical protein DXG01_005129 [Tephrocybe rancida]|nr:hypothetical protein DXG01_005129 [Tephrocybe rancida]